MPFTQKPREPAHCSFFEYRHSDTIRLGGHATFRQPPNYIMSMVGKIETHPFDRVVMIEV